MTSDMTSHLCLTLDQSIIIVLAPCLTSCFDSVATGGCSHRFIRLPRSLSHCFISWFYHIVLSHGFIT